jgi:hypothetical protein
MSVRTNSDFLGAVRALLEALAAHACSDARAAIVNRVARRLGDEWYPAFLKMICVVAESDDPTAKQLLASTLAHAMRKGELPSGSLTSWGVGADWLAAPAGVPGSFFRSAPRRQLGPIEYVTSWHSQSTNRAPLSDSVYRHTLSRILQLFEACPDAARAYQAKLAADAMNALEGTYTEMTRSRLAAIAQLWSEGVASDDLATRASGRSS